MVAAINRVKSEIKKTQNCYDGKGNQLATLFIESIQKQKKKWYCPLINGQSRAILNIET